MEIKKNLKIEQLYFNFEKVVNQLTKKQIDFNNFIIYSEERWVVSNSVTILFFTGMGCIR